MRQQIAMQRYAQPRLQAQEDPYGGQFQRAVGRPGEPMMGVQGGPQWNNPMQQRQQMMAQLMQQQPAPMNSNPANLGAEMSRQKQQMVQPQFQAAVMPQGDMRRGALMELAKQGAPKLARPQQQPTMFAGGGLTRPGVMRRR